MTEFYRIPAYNPIFYAADEDFPASATCLLSNNATAFLPLGGLADTGEYTSRAIIDFSNDLESGKDV